MSPCSSSQLWRRLGTAGTAGRFSLDISSLYATRDASRPRGCARDEPARAPPGAEAAEEASPHMNAGLAYHVANALPGHELSPRGFARTSEHFTLYSPPIRSRCRTDESAGLGG